jgi:hypothetical protein
MTAIMISSTMKQEIEMTNMSLILKRNGFEKVAESINLEK